MKYWNIKKSTYSISDFIQWYEYGSLNLNPKFQRRPVWRAGAKSYLMDTIVRGLPIPVIILREQKANLETLKPVREVVDGQQRIRTIISFVKSELLRDYKNERDYFTVQKNHNPDINGLKYDQLSAEVRQRILDYEFSVHILPAGASDADIYEIFSRMNATGYKLNHQELRNSKYYGAFKTYAYKMASEQLNRFLDWNIFSENEIARMEEVQLISEFAILILKKDIVSRSQLGIWRFYRVYDDKYEDMEQVSKKIELVFNAIEDYYGDEIKNSIFKKKTLFYSLFAIIYNKLYNLKQPKVKPNKVSKKDFSNLSKIEELIRINKVPKEVLDSTTRRTTNIDSRRKLYNYLNANL